MYYLDHTKTKMQIGSSGTDLKVLKIARNINDHTRVNFQVLIQPEDKDDYKIQRMMEQPVKVIHKTEEKEIILFQGVITECDMVRNRDEYILYGAALSYTYYLDIVKRSRSFQNINQTKQAFFEQIITMDEQEAQKRLAPNDNLAQDIMNIYSRAYIIDYAIDPRGSVPKGKFDAQLGETDWVLLMRKTSEKNAGLIVDDTIDAPAIKIGIPDDLPEEELPAEHYTMHRDLATFRRAGANDIEKLPENGFFSYSVESDRLLSLGQRVKFLGRTMYIASSVSTLDENGAMTNEYLLTIEDGLKIPTYHNPLFTGESLQGRVIDVERDKIKVHISSIDREQDLETAYWMPYSTMYSSGMSHGWYAMPEKGDIVRVHFPNDKEEDCVGISSVSKETPQTSGNAQPQHDGGDGGGNKDQFGMDRDRLQDPAVKSLMTAYGKEIILHPNFIRIHGKGVTITLDDGGGIEINTDKSITMNAKENVVVNAKKILVEGTEKISMSCNGGNLEMTPGEMVLSGPQVKIN